MSPRWASPRSIGGGPISFISRPVPERLEEFAVPLCLVRPGLGLRRVVLKSVEHRIGGGQGNLLVKVNLHVTNQPRTFGWVVIGITWDGVED